MADTTPTESDARAMALRFLGRREYAVSELLRKLTQRGVEDALAESVVAELVDGNYLSDQRYAEARARQRVQKGYGAQRIRAELRQKGVADHHIDAALAETAEDWHDLARTWAERRHRGPLDEKARARLYRAGMNRGFSHDQVMRAIDHLRTLDPNTDD